MTYSEDKFVERVWNYANQFVGKTISAPNDYNVRKLASEAKEKAKAHQWLYHCTNTKGALGILKSKEFWLTNLKNVNDREEVERIDAPNYEKSYYVSCFTYDSRVPDIHWQEYGTIDNGIIIGVKQDWFSKTPVFMTTSFQKCDEKIFNNSKEALDYKIEQEAAGQYGIDPYHIFDFDFYQIVYDDELKSSILGECSINFGDTVVPGRSVSQSAPGIIKSRAGWCKRDANKEYWKDWESEKEVRLKVGVHRLSHNYDSSCAKDLTHPYFRHLVVPLMDNAFNEIRISFSPQYKDSDCLLKEIQALYPNSSIECI